MHSTGGYRSPTNIILIHKFYKLTIAQLEERETVIGYYLKVTSSNLVGEIIFFDLAALRSVKLFKDYIRTQCVYIL